MASSGSAKAKQKKPAPAMSESQLTPSYESPGGFESPHGYFSAFYETMPSASATPDDGVPVKPKKPRKERIKLACDNCELGPGAHSKHLAS